MTRPLKTSDELVWDDIAGAYLEDPVGPSQIFSGPGLVSSKGWTPNKTVSSGSEENVSTYNILTEVGTVEFKSRDLVEVLSSMRDQRLIGKKFVVKAPVLSSFAVSQKVLAEIWDGEPPR